jgi:hypothetical protein
LSDFYYYKSCDHDSGYDYITPADYYDNQACDYDNKADRCDNGARDLVDGACNHDNGAGDLNDERTRDYDNGACGTGYNKTGDCIYMGECADGRWNTFDTGRVFYLYCEKEKGRKEGRIGYSKVTITCLMVKR